ncbi:hypothetical protein A4R63_03930 [Corynebacterium pseudotuberculosis]|uniref:Rv1157c family protein n=1 Tax=Corynebacterium pseudotuberculosis TaxID=1719 RepID=UPI0002593A1F|nr:hypothetical protein [Corynebacterium pseudotuberculosis]AFH90591.1 hypothetical protein CP31_04220 [Corynebacterium pseudotuberculosis 31]APB10697.1 hypothetical protein A4R72_04140 [Corynebacterium pseudotuberculosis]APB12743.1 hypothetical protein A4R71_04155 [Corynebacterium pseudotuberculosis]APB14794.1 hypothetical protein A4R68_04150 [Corynebacterium pseudotuberculosis]APB16836.1 hypothetical protein A4R67_04145 [Corynebacterium pseudotuberculosis]
MRRITCAITATLFAAACTIASGGSANAMPAQPLPVAPLLSSSSTINLSSWLPLDQLSRPNAEVLSKAKDFADTLPEPLRNQLLAAVAFIEGTGQSEIKVPDNGPQFSQFLWPSIAGECINGHLTATGSAIAVPGPAEIPAPGAKEGETAFVFTALGTGKLGPNEHQAMNVHWFNLSTLQGGSTRLAGHGINPEGPSTVSGTADTGKGRVIALIEGTIATEASPCTFLPTAALFEVK